MSNVGEALKVHLEADATVFALVSTRIHPSSVPTSNVFPYIVYEQTNEPTTRHMLAASKPTMATFEIDCYSNAALGAYTLADAVREAIDGFLRGKWGTLDVTSVTIDQIRDGFNVPDKKNEIGTFIRTIDVDIWYQRSIPTFP